MSTHFGRRLRELREAAKLARPQLAAAAGISLQALYRLEKGEDAPKLETAQRLAQVLGVSTGAFDPPDQPPPQIPPPPRKRGRPPGKKGDSEKA